MKKERRRERNKVSAQNYRQRRRQQVSAAQKVKFCPLDLHVFIVDLGLHQNRVTKLLVLSLFPAVVASVIKKETLLKYFRQMKNCSRLFQAC